MLGDEVHPHELSLFLKRLSRRKKYKELARFVPEWSTTARVTSEGVPDQSSVATEFVFAVIITGLVHAKEALYVTHAFLTNGE